MTIPDFIVRVHCLTYNHAAYIEDAMNGFCSQETTFPYVCTIVDDASTDGEQDVIRNYLELHFDLQEDSTRIEESEDYKLIYSRNKTNHNCYFAVFFLKYNHHQIKKSKDIYYKDWNYHVKYIALCEGDDYWISSRKLQTQVDFLNNHPFHSLCIHGYRKDELVGNNLISREIFKYQQDVEIIPDKDVINGTGMFCATASMVYRTDAVKDYPEWTRKAPVGDRPLKFVLFARGYIAYINEVMSVYRVGIPGSWTVRVNRNRKENRQSRKKFVQLLVDFDEWTNKKYYCLVKRAIYDYKKACMKSDLRYFLFKPYRKLKSLIIKK